MCKRVLNIEEAESVLKCLRRCGEGQVCTPLACRHAILAAMLGIPAGILTGALTSWAARGSSGPATKRSLLAFEAAPSSQQTVAAGSTAHQRAARRSPLGCSWCAAHPVRKMGSPAGSQCWRACCAPQSRPAAGPPPCPLRVAWRRACRRPRPGTSALSWPACSAAQRGSVRGDCDVPSQRDARVPER